MGRYRLGRAGSKPRTWCYVLYGISVAVDGSDDGETNIEGIGDYKVDSDDGVGSEVTDGDPFSNITMFMYSHSLYLLIHNSHHEAVMRVVHITSGSQNLSQDWSLHSLIDMVPTNDTLNHIHCLSFLTSSCHIFVPSQELNAFPALYLFTRANEKGMCSTMMWVWPLILVNLLFGACSLTAGLICLPLNPSLQ